MKLSHLSETLIGSEIVKLGGEIREKIRPINILADQNTAYVASHHFYHPCKSQIPFDIYKVSSTFKK